MPVGKRQSNNSKQRHRPGCEHRRCAGQRLRDQRQPGARGRHLQLEGGVSTVMQEDPDDAAGDEEHHQQPQRTNRRAARCDQYPGCSENARNEQRERRQLRGHFVVTDQQEFQQSAAATGKQTPQEDVADGAERSGFHDRTLLHVFVRLTTCAKAAAVRRRFTRRRRPDTTLNRAEAGPDVRNQAPAWIESTS